MIDIASAIRGHNFKFIGQNVKISPKASIYNAENIEIGNNVRIDDFCILSAGEGGIKIGDNIHIATGTTLIGQGRITLHDFSQISSRCSIWSSTDDFSGEHLVGPCINDKYKAVYSDVVTLHKHVLLGCGTVVLPGVTIYSGASIGALSLVKESIDGWGIYAGNPLRFIKNRSKKMIELENEMMNEIYQGVWVR